MMHDQNFTIIFLGQMGFAVLIGLYVGTTPATMVAVFPARVRCSALSLCYNICNGVLGGTTPLVATYLISRSHDDLSPAFYLMAAAALSLPVILSLHDTAMVPLK